MKRIIQVDEAMQSIQNGRKLEDISTITGLSRYEINQICEIYQLKEIPITASNKYKTF